MRDIDLDPFARGFDACHLACHVAGHVAASVRSGRPLASGMQAA